MSLYNYYDDEKKNQWNAEINTQYVPLRQNTEEKVRGKGLKSVWNDTNEWNMEGGWKTEKKGPKVLKSA